MKTIAVALFLALCGLSEGFWFGNDPIDCEWLKWKDTKCVKAGNGNYKIVEERTKMEASNGGKDCVGQATRMVKSCKVQQLVASTLIETFTTVGRVGGTTKSDSTCGTSFTDPGTGLRMLGAKCNSLRNRIVGKANSTLTAIINKPRVKRQFGGSVTSLEHRDILFLIDDSGSVGDDHFKLELALAKTIAGKFCGARKIAQDSTRVAAMTFGSRPREHIKFNDYFDRTNVLNAFNRIRYGGGSTCLIDALNHARNVMFKNNKGSRIADPNYNGLLILITDGCLNCYRGDTELELRRQAKLFEDKGISIVTFMVGMHGPCVEKMLSLNDGSTCFQSFVYPNWQIFEDTRIQIEALPCIDRWTKNNLNCPT